MGKGKLANLTLNGLAKMLKEKYWVNGAGTIHRRYNKEKIHTCLYADDFIITGTSKEVLETIQQEIERFLDIRGLELSREKTVITHIDIGFDFLGWHFRKYNGKLLVTPSKNAMQRISQRMKETIRENLMQKQDILIRKLNPIIRGWCNYHSSACAKQAYQKLDKYIFEALWYWAKRRHSTKSKSWRKDRYWSRTKYRDWIFQSKDQCLLSASDTKINRHVLIKLEANPYFTSYACYYDKRTNRNSLRFTENKSF